MRSRRLWGSAPSGEQGTWAGTPWDRRGRDVQDEDLWGCRVISPSCTVWACWQHLGPLKADVAWQTSQGIAPSGRAGGSGRALLPWAL